MATISTTGVVDGQIIFAVHVTRIVNALDGTASNNIIINADLTQGSLTNTTNSTNSHAEGEGTIASGNYSHAEGKNSSSTGTHAHAEGFNNIASGDYSHAEGSDSESSGDYSHAEGLETISTGDYSHASGYGTIAYSDYQAAVGRFNLDLNNDDYFVVGVGADAGNRADGLGINDTRTYISNSLFLPNLSNTPKSHVLAYDSTSKQVFFAPTSSVTNAAAAPPDKAIQFNSGSAFSGSANFIYNYTVNSLAQGLQNSASGQYSHAQGLQTTASGQYSHASGWRTIAYSDYQVATGQFNTDTNTADYFVVGVGPNVSNRKNGLGVNGSRTYISNSLFLPDLTNTSQTSVLTFDATTKQVYYTASSALIGATVTPGGQDKSIQFNSASAFSGSGRFTFDYTTNRVNLTGSLIVTGSVTASKLLISASDVRNARIIGSGSSAPTFGVYGSLGELFTVTDISSGSLFSVNDISGLPILDVYSDNTVLIGDSTYPSYHTSDFVTTAGAGAFKLGAIPTSSYDGGYFEYVVKSGSNARSGHITSTWSGTTVVSSSISSSDIGSTSGLTLFVALSSSYAVLSGSAPASGWTVKSIIRAI